MGRQERRTGGRREKTPGRIRGPFEIVGEGRPSGKVEASMFLCFHGATLETHEMKSTGRTDGRRWLVLLGLSGFHVVGRDNC